MRDNRNFWLFAMGRFVSLVGSGVQDVALPLFILDLTGSGTIMGTFMIISMLPRLLLYPIAGILGNRINRKWIMVWMDFGRGVVIILLALLASKNLITIPILFGTQLEDVWGHCPGICFNGDFKCFCKYPLNVEFQQLVPTEYRARVFSVLEVMSQGIIPIGYGLVGILLDKTPTHLIALSLAVLVLFLVLLFVTKYSKAVFIEFESRKKEAEMEAML